MPLPMKHTAAEIIRDLLVAAKLGSDPGSDPDLNSTWPVFATNEPSEPDNCITVYDTSPKQSGRSMIDGEDWSHYGVQIRIRAVDHRTGAAKAWDIHETMTTALYQNRIALDGVDYLVPCLANVGPPLALGVDNPNSRRSLFTLNAVSSIQPV